MVESNNLLFFSFKFEKLSFWSLYKVNKSEVRRKYGDGPFRTIDNLEEVEK
jgi:hypothetical protein